MADIDNGGSVFPVTEYQADPSGGKPTPYNQEYGMSLLDYFAEGVMETTTLAIAVNVYIGTLVQKMATLTEVQVAELEKAMKAGSDADIAKASYDMATAMVAEKRRREKGESK